MTKQLLLNEAQMASFRQRLGDKKTFAQCLMPIRGPHGFRKLDYDYPNQIDPTAIINKIVDCGFNAFALVVKDTDGATIANTQHSWNPSGRDLTKEFAEICQKRNLGFFLSFTDMNDAYRGYTNPETVSVHYKDGKDHKAGDVGTHREGEMRVDLPYGVTFEEMKKRIPFLTEEYDDKPGPARADRGVGYVPMTSFHCPRSEHTDYLLTLVKELLQKYPVDGIFADYIRYHHGYTDLCACPRCRNAFAEKYPQKKDKIMKCSEWWDFREDNIVDFGHRFQATVKAIDEQIITGWFNLPGPSIYSRRLVAQNYRKLGATMDCVIPMTYPYLTGTEDDGWKWGKMGDMMMWYSKKNMKHRFHEYGDGKTTVFCVTNTVECNTKEMLRQCMAFDYGLGIALFKYSGTTESQWYACKLYGELLRNQSIGTPPPNKEEVQKILNQVYEKYPPKIKGKI